MLNIDNMSNRTILMEQYKNTSNLELRQGLHEKYSTNKMGFSRWMFEQYPFSAGCKVLELGSGRGDLWTYYYENDVLQGYEMDITLSDFSDGMVDYMQQRYSGKKIS